MNSNKNKTKNQPYYNLSSDQSNLKSLKITKKALKFIPINSIFIDNSENNKLKIPKTIIR